jgi:single-strand DNA-binding protein
MLQLLCSGNITRDAVIRQAGRDNVCSFSVACNRKVKGEKQVTYIDCSMFGKRGEAVQPYLTKGTRVTVIGEFSTRVHENKTYLQCRVSELDFAGGQRSGGNAPPPDDDGSGKRTGFDGPDAGYGEDSGDSIPF